MKKSFLDIEFDFDFRLWGIATTLRDFQVALVLNRTLDTQFRRSTDLEISNPGKLSYYSLFRFEDERDKGLFHIIANKYQGGYLVPEIKEADFFLRFSGEAPAQYLDELQRKLKRIPHFMALIPLQPNKLRSKMNLVVE